MTKEKLVCGSCGSDNFVRDAWARWDVPTQQFELHSSFDDGMCLDCEETGRGLWVEVKVNAPEPGE